MALPAVMMAYKEKDNIAKLVVYVFVGIAVLYLLYKIFKVLQKFEKAKDAVKHAVSGIKQKIDDHITTSSEYYERIRKEKEEIPAKVEKLAKEYNLSKKEKEELKESMLREVETKEQIPFFYSYHGGAVDYRETLKKEREKQKRILKKKVGLKEGSRAWKKQVDIEAKRWNAIADYYKPKPLPKANPMPRNLLREKLRKIENLRHPFVPKREPVYKYQPLPRNNRSRFIR